MTDIDKAQLQALGTTPSGATVAIEPEPQDDGGMRSRKFLASIVSAGATLVGAFVFLGIGKISEAGAIHLVEVSLILVGTYCGANVVQGLGGLAIELLGRFKAK